MRRKLSLFVAFSLVLYQLIFLFVPSAEAATVNYSFKTTSNYFNEPSVYTISFLAPKGLQIGYIGVSFSNPYVDFSSASLSVSGISGGSATVDYDRGISGNHDLQYRLSSLYTVPEDTWITLTVNGAKNPPGSNGSVGFDYISVYDSINSSHDAFWTYNKDNGTQLRMPTNHYVYLKEYQTAAPAAPIEPVSSAPEVIQPTISAPSVPVIIQNTTIISITSVFLAAFFYFEGSETTNLKDIEDPKHVNDFTLDTKYGWTLEYEEEIDFTDKKKIQAIENVDKLITFDYWFIWFKVEWWVYFDVPVTLTYKNESLTEFAPNFKTYDTKSEAPVKLLEQDEGELKLQVTDAVKIDIVPRLEITEGENIRCSGDSYTISVRSSHKDLEYELKVNGQTSEYQPKDFDNATGSFNVEITDLVEGANFVQLSYKDKKAVSSSLAMR